MLMDPEKCAAYRLARRPARHYPARPLLPSTVAPRSQRLPRGRAGLVAYSAFLKLVRTQLSIPEGQAPSNLLRSVWKALDYDDTGYVNSAKWGPFMKRGEAVVPRPGLGQPTWKERLVASRHSDKQAMDKERDGEKLAMVGVEPARDADVLKLAERINTQLISGRNWAGGPLFPTDLQNGQSTSLWYQLFRKIDPYGNGVFNFKQFVRGVREELLIGEQEWPEERLKMVTPPPLPSPSERDLLGLATLRSLRLRGPLTPPRTSRCGSC